MTELHLTDGTHWDDITEGYSEIYTQAADASGFLVLHSKLRGTIIVMKASVNYVLAD